MQFSQYAPRCSFTPPLEVLSSCEPFTLGMGDEEKSVTAKTPVYTNKIYQIGFHVHKLNPADWAPGGSIVTVLIEPAEDAGPIPERPYAP